MGVLRSRQQLLAVGSGFSAVYTRRRTVRRRRRRGCGNHCLPPCSLLPHPFPFPFNPRVSLWRKRAHCVSFCQCVGVYCVCIVCVLGTVHWASSSRPPPRNAVSPQSSTCLKTAHTSFMPMAPTSSFAPLTCALCLRPFCTRHRRRQQCLSLTTARYPLLAARCPEPRQSRGVHAAHRQRQRRQVLAVGQVRGVWR